MIKSDRWIRQQAVEKDMIKPFEERQVRTGVISYGVSSYGYRSEERRVGKECRL